MRVITFHLENLSRGKGRSVVQMAAYCGREKLHCVYSGQTHHIKKEKRFDLVYSKIMLPSHAPDKFLNRETLWNEVELIEKNKNARLARSIYFSLPNGLTTDTQIKMTKNYVQEFFIRRGMCADIFIHDKGDGNPHVHLLATTRSLGENGQWQNKRKRVYLLNSDGTKARDPKTGKLVHIDTVKITDWDNRENIEIWRKGWADICNKELEREGLERVTHMSYARQGLDIKPTKHKGRKVIELERRRIITDRSNENRSIDAHNKEQRLNKERNYEISRSR